MLIQTFSATDEEIKSFVCKKQNEKEKKEVLTKEDFFKALNKVVLTIKKPKSPEKEKKKTSE